MSASTALFAHLPLWMIDKLALLACFLVFGDTAKHGLPRPKLGPFARKIQRNAYPVIDVGTYNKIRAGQIQVLPAMTSIDGDMVEFGGGRRHRFDAIVFATGYRSTTKRWLKSVGDGLIGDDGMAAGRSPKGENRLYRAGLAGRGIFGSGTDVEFVAEDINEEVAPVSLLAGPAVRRHVRMAVGSSSESRHSMLRPPFSDARVSSSMEHREGRGVQPRAHGSWLPPRDFHSVSKREKRWRETECPPPLSPGSSLQVCIAGASAPNFF